MKTNLPVNVASALCYVPFVGWVAAVVFLLIESEKTVRYHAVRSLIINLVTWIFFWFPPVFLAYIIGTIVLAVKAYNNEKVDLNFLDRWTEKILEKITAATAKK
jgi:uncharacterized membrane protein